MLKPAILYEKELTELFKTILYTDDYFYYCGYGHCHSIPEFKVCDNYYNLAIVDDDNDHVVGYLSYYIDSGTDGVERFGLISFDKGNMTVISDTKKRFEELVKTHKRVEWRCVEGNPVLPVYDKMVQRYNGYKHTLHKATLANDGTIRDCYIYEIVKPE